MLKIQYVYNRLASKSRSQGYLTHHTTRARKTSSRLFDRLSWTDQFMMLDPQRTEEVEGLHRENGSGFLWTFGTFSTLSLLHAGLLFLLYALLLRSIP
jgi:hypothetical protein